MKSGTNQIHGSAFEFYRSGKWAANPNYQFLDATATPALPYRHEQFGGSAGGPIIRSKLFLFGDYQGTRIGSPDGTHYDTVPTSLMRQGNFSELLTTGLATGDYTYFPICVPNSGSMNSNIAQYSKGQIYDPQTCAPFSGNILPAGRLNPAAVNYLNAFPFACPLCENARRFVINFGILASIANAGQYFFQWSKSREFAIATKRPLSFSEVLVVPSEDTGERVNLMLPLFKDVRFARVGDHLGILIEEMQRVIKLFTLRDRHAWISFAMQNEHWSMTLLDITNR